MGTEDKDKGSATLRWFCWREHATLGRALIVGVELREPQPHQIGTMRGTRGEATPLHATTSMVRPYRVLPRTFSTLEGLSFSRYRLTLGEGEATRLLLDVNQEEAELLCRWVPPPPTQHMARMLDAYLDPEPA